MMMMIVAIIKLNDEKVAYSLGFIVAFYRSLYSEHCYIARRR